MAKYARGKKSYAISDRGGQRVRYTQLKTTWDGLRVAPDEWEPKHPQLTPAKNIIDAQQLFKPRSTGQDREDVSIQIAYTWDIFAKYRKLIGTVSYARVGVVSIDLSSVPSPLGLGGTGGTGAELLELTLAETGVGGTAAVGTITPTDIKGVSGSGGTGGVGVEALSLSINEAGVGGTGGVGAEVLILTIAETGVSGDGDVGNENIVIDESGWGGADWNDGTWGN
tara:strand:+ start:554 stop:1228 length:675 start_codon:yes stop_codon:yes gene_type:complete